LPLRVEDGCQGGLGHALVEATVLLVDALLTKLAVSFLLVALCHVVFALTPGASLHFLLVSFSLLWRGLLPILILFLLNFGSIVPVVLLFLAIATILLLVSSFPIILDSCVLLEVGCKLELTLEGGKFSLQCYNFVFIW
jgi:hypothetical protein